MNAGLLAKRSMLLLCIVLIFSACSMEYKLAHRQGIELKDAALLMLFPDTLFLTNDKAYAFPASLDSMRLYRASIDSSDFLRYISCDSFLLNFKQSVIETYKQYGFRVYTREHLDSFLAFKQTAYVLEFTQLELQEWWKPFKQEELMPDEKIYTERFSLNALSLNAWVSIGRLNQPEWGKNLVFTHYDIADEVDGNFYQNNLSGEVYYSYKLTPLTKERIPELNEYGTLSITLDLLDFIIDHNVETGLQLFKGSMPRNYYHYTPRSEYPLPSGKAPQYILIQVL